MQLSIYVIARVSVWIPGKYLLSSYVITRFSALRESVCVFSMHWEQCRQKGFPAKIVTKLKSVLLSEL